MNKIDFINGQAPYINSDNLKTMQDNAELKKYNLTLESELADNSQLTVPANYRVGTDCLQVYFERLLNDKKRTLYRSTEKQTA